jgi:cytochrome d ubiquinol oxidase subunit I
MEGTFSFFLESSFLGAFLYGEKRLGPKAHWFTALLVFRGSWLSGFFIVATDAWMQHPVGYAIGAHGEMVLTSFWSVLLNPWLGWQYLHTMSGSVVTASVAMASVGAFYLLKRSHEAHGRTFVRLGVISAIAATIVLLFPSGDGQGRNIARHQPATLAAMEGLFDTEQGAPLAILGQPDMDRHRLDNPLVVPRALSFLTYQSWGAEVKGLSAFPPQNWPDSIPLLYYSYHIMVGLGTIFGAVLAFAAFKLWLGSLYQSRGLLWVLMMLLPFPYIANTAGWITAEVGRQPWLIYGIMRTPAGVSTQVSSGNALFTLIGFLGIYTILSILFLFLVYREVEEGPEPAPAA